MHLFLQVCMFLYFYMWVASYLAHCLPILSRQMENRVKLCLLSWNWFKCSISQINYTYGIVTLMNCFKGYVFNLVVAAAACGAFLKNQNIFYLVVAATLAALKMLIVFPAGLFLFSKYFCCTLAGSSDFHSAWNRERTAGSCQLPFWFALECSRSYYKA